MTRTAAWLACLLLTTAPAWAAEVTVTGRVVISEPLGAETLVTFQVGQSELVARCPASFKAAPGSTHALYMDPAAMHLFDPATGQAL